MLFQDSAYGYFLVAVVALFWAVRKDRRARNLVLLAASWFFYACWDWRFLSLICFSTALDFVIGRALYATDDAHQNRRRLLLTASLVGNLALLGFFKYFGFFVENLEELLGVDVPALDVVLPVGISFYTLQTLSYTLDIFHRRLKPTESWTEFALFVAFFPQLVAGPIVRAVDFLPQLDTPPWLDRERVVKGLGRIMLGLVKKVAIADVVGTHIVAPIFDDAGGATGLEAWIGMYAFTLQIYCDFSGYSDIAIGSARLFGLRIPENFVSPYKATSITDFWRRWHVSLSTWLRDYLYIPLGGNRRGTVRTYVNLMATMLLSGLWHGAAWKFVVWGGLHGLWLAVERLWRGAGLWWPQSWFGRLCGFVFTFHFVGFAFVVFRAPDLAAGAELLATAAGLTDHAAGGLRVTSPTVLLTLFAGLLLHLTPIRLRRLGARAFVGLPGFVHGVLLAVVIGLLAYAAVDDTPFIYFQF